jgi:UPF0716 protein FxsA
MAGVLVLIILVLPFVELAVFIGVVDQVGFLPALGVIVVLGLAGGWLVKRQGVGVWRRADAQLRSGEMPTAEVVNGLLLLIAGFLLILPGLVSDLLGIALLLPPVRAAVRSLLFRRFEKRIQATFSGPVGAAFGRGGPTRINTGRASYSGPVDVREAGDPDPHGAGRPGLERP